MDRTRFADALLYLLMLLLALPTAAFSQQDSSDPLGLVEQAVRSGTLTQQEVQEGLKALEKGRVPAAGVERFPQESKLGTLTRKEIEAGKKLLEQQQPETAETSPNVVYLYGNVVRPGPYDVQPDLSVSDLIPDSNSLGEDTYFGYALIKRYQIVGPDGEIVAETDMERIDAFYPSARTAKEVTLIPFDLGRLLAHKDKTQDIPLMPGDEIYIFSRSDIHELEASGTEPETEEAYDKYEMIKQEMEAAPLLEIFGHNLFLSPPSTFAPIAGMPVSNDYVIGPGDEIRVTLWGRLEESYLLTVDNEGGILFPKIGRLSVAGLTFSELKEMIRRKAEAITGVSVDVTMGRLRTIQVFVLGEVKSPGLYTVSSLSTVINALLASGGPTRLGSLRNIQLKRNYNVLATIDIYDFILKGDTSKDARLMPGDVLFVSQAGPMVSVSGSVKRPAVYELKDNATLQNAIHLAGGFAATAFNQRIQIERAYQNTSNIVRDITYDELKKEKPISLEDGDLIKVFSIIPQPLNAIFLFGNVLRPGQYAYRSGIRILDIVGDPQKLDRDTFYDYALVKRYKYDDMKAELIPFDLGRLLLLKDGSQNITLMPRDEIYIFNKSQFEDKPYAVVEGEVREPGTYIIDDMRIRDLILKAGDLTADAYLPKGEIIRIDETHKSRTLYFNIEAAMAGAPNHNLPVKSRDKVVIHSIWEEKWRETVTIEGDVNTPGEFLLTSDMRLKDLIFKAAHLTREAYLEVGHIFRTDPKTKEITIHTVNLKKALEGDFEDNIQLQDLDRVLIHNIWDYKEKYTVKITGLVRNPGDYPFATNMTVRDLILVAGNVRDGAYMDEAELARFEIVDGNRVETSIHKLNLKMVMADAPDNNLALQPLDVLLIKEIPEWWNKKRTVAISGEVHFPGTYQLRKDDRLSDLIERAGGFADSAYLRGTVFTRESVKALQQQRIDEMVKRLEIESTRLSSAEVQAAVSKEELAAQVEFISAQQLLIDKLKDTEATGRVVISLLPVEELRNSSMDMVLEDGDTLKIPKKPNIVTILGAVYNPTSLLYDKERPAIRHYLEATGGPTENAREQYMYVVQADGTVISKRKGSWWKDFEETKLYPGDTVLVPEKIVRPSYMRDIKDITQILYQIAVTAGITITQVF
jgi:polysaccharide biosynthesis/export protein